MRRTIRKWIKLLQHRPSLVAFGLVAAGLVGVLLIGLTALASDDIPLPRITPLPTLAPSIQLSPAAGPPGTFVTATGAGWRPGETVFVRLDAPSPGVDTDVYLASATVTAEGRFSASFVFPSDPDWSGPAHVLVAAQEATSGNQAWATLQVPAPEATPVPTSTPSQAPTETPTRPSPTATPPTPTLPAPTPTASPTPIVAPSSTPLPAITAWRGEYYHSRDLTGAPALVRNDVAVNFNWGSGAPAAGLPADGFSARWTRVLPFEDGQYRFHALVDDGVRLYVDDALVIDDWRDGGRRELAADRRLAAGSHSLRIEYYERTGDALIQAWWEKASSYPDWRGEYWPNRKLEGSPALVRNDYAIDFDWREGTAAASLPTDSFSARWMRTAEFDRATYRFHVLVDDGARLWVDDQLIVDSWHDGGARELTADYALTKGTHRLRVEFYEHTGNARIRVWWKMDASPSFPDWKAKYWSNRKLRGDPALVRNDEEIDFRWNKGTPAPGLPADEFSARWSREIDFKAGLYRFYARADDGMRVIVDGDRVLDAWHDGSGDELYTVDLKLRGEHQVVVEYYERGGKALVEFWWRRVGDWPTQQPPTSTPTATPPNTPTATPTSTPTATPTITPTIPPTATPTPTPSPTPSPTSTPVITSTGARLNEILPAPAAIDWDGDGIADDRDEWIELHNASAAAVDLTGWSLDDGPGSGQSHRIPEGTVLPPGAFAVLYRRDTGIALPDSGGQVRLLSPDGAVIDDVVFGALDPDRSISRDDDGAWHASWPPSLQAPNWPPSPPTGPST